MQFDRLPLGVYQANCYILYDENTKEAAVIDPGGDFELLKSYLDSKKLIVKFIFLTHGHGDHIGAIPELKAYTGAPVCIHMEDCNLLRSSRNNFSRLIGGKNIELEADRKLLDGEIFVLGNAKLEIIHTPGHTRGGICIKCGDLLFSGDTLFACSVGRSDLEGGSHETLISSIKSKLLILPEETQVLPGHGPSSTIQIEKKRNPFLI